MPRVELGTSSLPRKRSTTELHRLVIFLSGRPGSNRRHSAWKADALPTELLPLLLVVVGRAGFEPAKVKPTDLQSVLVGRLSISPTFRADGGIRTPDQLITNQLLWPTELHRQICWYTKKRTYSFPNCLILGLQMYETFFYHKLF